MSLPVGAITRATLRSNLVLLFALVGCSPAAMTGDAGRDVTAPDASPSDTRVDAMSDGLTDTPGDSRPAEDVTPTDALSDATTGGYYECPASFITPATSVSWIRDVYIRDNDYPTLGCPTGPEAEPTSGPWAGQTDPRFVSQPYANGTCIGWDWTRGCDFPPEPGHFIEMPCGNVGHGAEACGFHPITPPGSLDCDVTPAAGVFTRCRTSDHSGGYYLLINNDVATTMPQRVAFNWHGCNTSVDYIRSSLDLEVPAAAAGDHTIFVYPLVSAAHDNATAELCYDNATALALFERILSDLRGAYSIDANQVFSAGYSSGGLVSDYLACRSPNVHAIAPDEGGMLTVDATPAACTQHADAFIIHNPDDLVVGWNWGTNAFWGYRGLTALYASNACAAGASFCSLSTLNTYTTASQSAGMPRGVCDFTCPAGHRLRLWLHAKVDTWNAGTAGGLTYHTIPDGAAAAVWNFFMHR